MGGREINRDIFKQRTIDRNSERCALSLVSRLGRDYGRGVL